MISRDQEIELAIDAKDITSISTIFFASDNGTRRIRDGLCHESELWDYKQHFPDTARSVENDKSWSDLAATVLGFYNRRGGLIIFGVTNTFDVPGVRTRVDSKICNEKFRRFISDRIWVEFQRLFISADQTCVALLIVPPRVDRLERFTSSSVGFRYRFSAKQSAIREGDSIRILTTDEVAARTRQLALPTIDNPYEIDEPNFRLLRSEFQRFVYRTGPCEELESALRDPRTSVISLNGIGGTGKTALASWATKRAYDRRDFSFIASITAKDRALTPGGIISLAPQLSNFETLLDAILSVLGWSDMLQSPLEEKATTVKELIAGSNGLIFVDNLETIDDARIIDFLESLPIGVKAITTSRTPRVKKLVSSIELGPLREEEVVQFVMSYSDARPWVSTLDNAQALTIGVAGDGMPLAIEWILKRAHSAGEALANATALRESGAKREQLLEFCFRRVFETMPEGERMVLRTLAAVTAPLGMEPVIAATDLGARANDVLDKLRDETLIQRVFNEESGTYRFTLLPLVRAFVSSDTALRPLVESRLRKRLSDWFQALDISEPSLRSAERQQRQGRQTSDAMLMDLGKQAERTKSFDAAKMLYERAFKTGDNYRAAQSLAEIYRHVDRNLTEALRWYSRAAVAAPKTGKERGLIFREWGMLLKQSGEPDAIDLAIDKFEESLKQGPDRYAALSLAALCDKKGSYNRVIQLRDILWDNADPETRSKSKALIVKAYQRMGNLLAAETLRLVPAGSDEVAPARTIKQRKP